MHQHRSDYIAALIAVGLVAALASCEGREGDLETKAQPLISQDCGAALPNTFMAEPCRMVGTLRICTCYPRSPTNPAQVVEWSTKDRLGPDLDVNGVVDLSPPGNPPAVSASRSTVITLYVNSCQSQRAPSNIWTVTNTSGFSKTFDGGTNCQAAFDLPDSGAYRVVLKATYDNGTKTTTTDIVVRNYVIASIGDSVASGEGVPDVNAGSDGWRPIPAVWENESCHRSAKSGPAQAALALERADKSSTVTFISNACSGARVAQFPFAPANGGGLLSPYRGIKALPNGQAWMSQVGALARVLCPAVAIPADLSSGTFVNPVKSQCRPIDALIITIGANDVGFGTAAMACALPGSTDCQNFLNGTIPMNISNGVVALPTYLENLKTAINNILNVNNVLFAEYHDPTSSQTGRTCTSIVLPNAIADQLGSGGIVAKAFDAYGDLSGWYEARISDGVISENEARFLHDSMVVPLNNAVNTKAKAMGWIPVSGIADEFSTHGYCAASSWVVHYEDSKLHQLDIEGTFHPNEAGHQVYKRHILQTLLATLPGAPANTSRRVIADMNGDRRSDLPISSGVGWGSIPVGLSQPDGSFSVVNQAMAGGDTQLPIYAAQNGARPLVGDFNGDGLGDVAFTGGIGWGSIPIAFSNGNGTFRGTNVGWAPALNFPSIASSYGAQPVSGDFDGDGKADIAVMGTGIAEIPVAFSNGDGTFRATNLTVTSGVSVTPHANAAGSRIVSGDFDGNGKTDIAIIARTSTKIPVAFSNGDGTFRGTVGGISSVNEQLFTQFLDSDGASLVGGDFNGDSLSDLAFVGGFGWATIPLALSNGDGAFKFVNATIDASFFAALASSHGAKPAAGDFNGDGVDDIALTGGTGWQSVPIAYSMGGTSFRAVHRGVSSGDTNFTIYANQTGATPSTRYPLNRVGKLNQAFYDTATACTVGGTTMHCCPAGSAMIGINVPQNKLKCAPIANATGTRSLDTTTVRNDMKACPLGQVMVGVHVDLNRLACQTIPGTYPVTVENIDTDSVDGSGMRVCNDTRSTFMSGIRVDQNRFTCTRGN